MYTRKYTDEDSELNIPSGYDGIALRQESEAQALENDVTNKDESQQCLADASPRENEKHEDSIFAGIPIFGKLKDSLSFGKNTKFNIGFEEILIAALALYLFFSKDGDKECAIMMAILLFIT